MTSVSSYKPLSHYVWGGNCDGWNFVDTDVLSVKQEKMPAGTTEKFHYHERAQQFFYILSGQAIVLIESEELILYPGEGIHITAGKKHKISNAADEHLEFILCSQPSTKNDRINVEQ